MMFVPYNKPPFNPDILNNPDEVSTRLDMLNESVAAEYVFAQRTELVGFKDPTLVVFNSRENNRLRLRQVFYADAKARIDELAPGKVSSLAWVDVAREEYRKMSELILLSLPDSQDEDDSPIKIPTPWELGSNLRMQKVAYAVMCQARISRGTYDISPKINYAARVAAGEIILGPGSVTDQIRC